MHKDVQNVIMASGEACCFVQCNLFRTCLSPGGEIAACVKLWTPGSDAAHLYVYIYVSMQNDIMKAALQVVRAGALPVPQAQPAFRFRHRLASKIRSSHLTRGLQVPNEPDFDDVKLDEAFYKELGIDEDEREAQKTYEPDDIGAAPVRHGMQHAFIGDCSCCDC